MEDLLNTPLVSICTPCYNHEKYLQDYFDSILNQSYKNMELIIADDCSSDSSQLIIEENLPRLKQRFKNVVYLKNVKNMGIPKNCNQILSYVKGKYIKWLASDDMMLEDCIKINEDYLENHPDIAMCHSKAFRVPNDYHYGDSYSQYPIHAERLYEHTISKNRISDFEKMLQGSFIVTPTFMIRSSIYQQYGNFDEAFTYEDVEYFTRILLNEKITFLNICLVQYRESDTSISNIKNGSKKLRKDKFKIKYKNNIMLYQKYLKYIKSFKRRETIHELYARYFLIATESKLIDESKYMLQKLKKYNVKIPYWYRKRYVLLVLYSIFHKN